VSGKTMADVDAERPSALAVARSDRFDCRDDGRGLCSRDFGGSPRNLRDLSSTLRILSPTRLNIVLKFEDLRLRRAGGPLL